MLRDVVWSDDGMYKVGDVYNPERFFSDALNNRVHPTFRVIVS